jgi:hypothetical protein
MAKGLELSKQLVSGCMVVIPLGLRYDGAVDLELLSHLDGHCFGLRLRAPFH